MHTQKSTRIARKLLSLLLALGMIISMLPMSALALQRATSDTWTKVDLADITADDTVAITMTASSGATYILPNAAATSAGPAAVAVTPEGDTLTADSAAYGWTVSPNGDGTYAITGPNGGLNLTAANTGVRVKGTSGVWSVTNGYLTSPDTNSVIRYLGVYETKPDWRCYTTIHANIADQTLQFWKLNTEPVNPTAPAAPTADVAAGAVAAGTVVTFSTTTEGATISISTDGGATWTEGSTYTVNEAVTLQVKATLNGVDSAVATFAYTIKAEVVLSTIAEAVAGADSASFSVKGAVTLLDGKNVYVQDETGGICLRFSAAPNDLSLGDTVLSTGTKSTYNGMPQLACQEYEKSADLTLAAKDATIGALTTADVCTYVHMTGLAVTEVYDNNGAYSNPNITFQDESGNTIQLYKAVIGKTDGAWDVSVGDTVELNAAVGINNSTLQLRNTLASEITVTSAGVKAPTADVAAGAVAAGTVVTFSTATEGATISISTDGGANWTEGSTYTVNEAVTLTVKATLNGVDSPVATFAYTIKTAAPTVLDKLTEAPADGSLVVLHHPGSNMALTANASGSKLAGTAATPTDGRLELADTMAYMTVHVTNDVYTFELNGSYLTSGETGNSLTFAADGTSELAQWTLEQQTDGTWYLMNVGAAFNGSHNQALEYYNGFTTYGVKTDNAAYKFDFYGVTATYGLVTDLEQLTDGAYVVIYNPGNSLAMTSETYGDWYLMPGEATITEGVVAEPAANQIWKVTVNEDGTYTFTQDSYAVAAWLSVNGTKTYVELTNNGSYNDATDTTWYLDVCNAETSTFYMRSGTLTVSPYEGVYAEVYNKTINGTSTPVFCGYATNASSLTESAYGMQFYLVPAPQQTEPATGETYGLTSTLATGDEVILYNAASGMGMGNAIVSHKVSGVALTPVDGVITTDKTDVVWTVTVNADGTYTFTQGNYTLGGVVSGDYNNLVVEGAAYTNWTLTGPDSSDFNYFLSLNDMATNFGKLYMEYYNGFTLYGSTAPDKTAFGITFYKKGAEAETPNPEETGDLVTSLDQLTDGATVAIYSPGHKTAISTKPNGDWYLKANQATVENGKVVNFTEDFVWTVKKNADGTYSFYANGDESRSITVWKSDTYAELSLNVATYPDNTWTLTPAKTANCYYFSSPTVSGDRGPAYIEAYVRNEFEVFSGYFTTTTSNKFTESEFALQFYLVNPDDAIAAYDDGEWDGVLQKGGQYVAYNATAASSIGLFAEANYSMRAIPTTIEGGKANAGNGAYVFTVDTMGRYYTFKVGDKFFATNASEELLFVEPNEDGSAPENAKWFLQAKDGGYIIYNKDATYNGTPVCVEYYSSVFSGWTFSTKNDVGIYLFNFYEVVDGTEIREGVVQAPTVIFDCDDSRYVEQDYVCSFSLDDLAESISTIAITYTAGDRTGTVALEDCTVSSDGKSYSFTIPAADIDAGEVLPSFTIRVNVTNSYDITYSGEKTVTIIDEPFFTDLTPAPNSQTRDDKRPTISVKAGNVGENPTLTMTVNGQAVAATFENGVLSYTPNQDMADGRVTVAVTAVRADGVKAEKTWNFTVGIAEYQLYFGQLHSHTTYSDGSGTLDTALEYIASLPESANIQFVAFTDHSNYFDTTSAANPADALNDKSLMTDASRALWEEYKGKAAAFNASHDNLLAIAGFEMTWSGGPGHINTFDSDGLVSRNNAALNNKSGDAGMKLYYETVNKGDSINQFNHPGTTFGNFTDFSYRDDSTDEHMFLVEVGNGEGQIGAGGYYPSYEQYIIALDKGWHVAPTNNQDNHKGRWGNANDARDVILTNDFSEQGIYDAIRALRVYATEDKNLQISYTINDEPMGTVFTDENAPEKLNVVVTLFDPDAGDSISKVELVSNAGVTAYTWDNAADLASGQLTAELDPEYSYYFVRVTQKDGDLAVTAPVWVGQAAKLGIQSFASTAEQVYVNESTTLTTTLFNNETAAATVKSLIYTVGGSEVIGTDTNTYTIPAGGTVDVSFAHTFTTAKLTTVTVTAIVEQDGKEYTFTANVELDILDRATADDVTPIADVRAASDPADTGYRFTIEGVVTSNASGYDKDTAFFDCIYVQDETGGICCFPVSGEYKIGDKVRIVGHTDFYQGEPELQVKTIEVIGEGTVTPSAIAAAELNDRSAEGKLVTVTGTVESVEEANGLIQTIMVKDANGDLARVFIDGYITTGHEVENCVVGAQISATGLASYDDTFNDPEGPFPRIRIRDRADVVCTAPAEGYHIIVTDYTKGAATTDIVADQTYSGEVTFTVTCDIACVVAIDNGEDSYTKLDCTTTESGEHQFTVTVTDADVTIAIALKGDATLDGQIKSNDAVSAKQAAAGTRTLTGMKLLTVDTNNDGRIRMNEATKVVQVAAGNSTFDW